MAKKTLLLKVKRLNSEATLPTKATSNDAGLDLTSITKETINTNCIRAIKTGIAVEIPEGYYGQIFERSGLSLQNNLKIKAGVVDSGYRGEIKVIFQNCGDEPVQILPGQKIAQMVLLPVPDVTILEVESLNELTSSERGEKGFGSSDN